MDLMKELKIYMYDQNLTVGQLAKLMQMSRVQLDRLLNGKSNLTERREYLVRKFLKNTKQEE